MKLGLKIILPILLLLIIILGAFGYLFYNLKQQEAVISAQGTKIQKLNSLNERLSRQQEQTESNVLAYRFNQDKSFLLVISQAELDKSKTLDEMSPFITTTKGRELVTSYINSRKEIESLRNGLIKAIDGGDKEQINQSYTKWSIQSQNIKVAMADIKAYNINSLENTLAFVQAIGNKISQVIIILAFIVIVTVLFLYFYLRVAITIPIIKLAGFADQLSKADFTTTTTTTTTTDISSHDEIGLLVNAFRNMSLKLKQSYQNLEDKILVRTKELESINARDEAILTSIGDGMVVVDKEGKITYVNRAFEKMVGWKTQEVLGKYIVDVVPREDEKGDVVPFKERILSKVLSGEEVIVDATNPFYYIRKDKSRFPASSIVTSIFLEEEIIGVVETFRDITRERELQLTKDKQIKHEIKIEAKEKDFVSFASHQLMTPLALVEGYLSMLISGKIGKVDNEAKKYLDESFQGSQRMTRLVKSMLTTSRLESGRIKIESSKFNLSSLLSDTVKEFQHMAQEKQLILAVAKLEPTIVMADINYTKEVISNLINNAIKYTEKGSIELNMTADKNLAVVTIRDTGIGINQEDLTKVFDKFYMSDNWIVKQSESNGLGLYIGRLLLDLMGGTIKAESTIGKGSLFTFTLPLAKKYV